MMAFSTFLAGYGVVGGTSVYSNGRDARCPSRAERVADVGV